MNARTIGRSGSGATELANVSAKALFLYLWNTFPDAVASVIGGRGVSAAEDFSAGRQIMIPTMQGLVAGGLDDMGSTPANRLQISAQLAFTAGSAAATVNDRSRIGFGMTIRADGCRPAPWSSETRAGRSPCRLRPGLAQPAPLRLGSPTSPMRKRRAQPVATVSRRSPSATCRRTCRMAR